MHDNGNDDLEMLQNPLRSHYETEGARVERYGNTSYWDSRYHQRRFQMVCGLLASLGPSGATFLDVGAGTGEYLDYMTSAGVIEAIAIDLSFNYCRRLSARTNLVAEASATSLPLASRCVDIVLCSEVIEHIPGSDTCTVISELCRVARRAVVITTPNRSALIRRIGRMISPGSVDSLDKEVGHINLMNAKEFRTVLGIDGWELKRLKIDHVLPPVIGETLKLSEIWARPLEAVERCATNGTISARAGNAMAAVLLRA